MEKKAGICRLDGSSDLLDRLHCADDVVGVHDRNQDRVWTNGGSRLPGRYQAVPVNPQPCDFKSQGLQIFHGFQHSGMLDLCRDQVFSFALHGHGGADDRQIVRLGPARSKADIFFLYLQDSGQSLPGLGNAPLGSDAAVVHGRRIAVILQKKFIHQRGGFRKAPGRRGIVEIDVSFFNHKSVLVSITSQSSSKR